MCHGGRVRINIFMSVLYLSSCSVIEGHCSFMPDSRIWTRTQDVPKSIEQDFSLWFKSHDGKYIGCTSSSFSNKCSVAHAVYEINSNGQYVADKHIICVQ